MSGKPCRCLPYPLSKKFLSNPGVRIYRIPCQVFETLSARVYLLLGAGPPTLVDAGSSLKASTRQILAGIETVRGEFGENVRLGDIRASSSATATSTTSAGLPELLRQMPAEVAVHPLDRGAIASPREHTVVGDSRLSEFLHQAGVDPARRAELLKISPYSGRLIEGVAGWADVGRRRRVGRAADHPHARPLARPRVHRRGQRAALGRPHPGPHAAPSMARKHRRLHGLGPLSGIARQDRAHARLRVGAGRPRTGDSRRVPADRDDSRARTGGGSIGCWRCSARPAGRFRSTKSS